MDRKDHNLSPILCNQGVFKLPGVIDKKSLLGCNKIYCIELSTLRKLFSGPYNKLHKLYGVRKSYFPKYPNLNLLSGYLNKRLFKALGFTISANSIMVHRSLFATRHGTAEVQQWCIKTHSLTHSHVLL